MVANTASEKKQCIKNVLPNDPSLCERKLFQKALSILVKPEHSSSLICVHVYIDTASIY